MKIFTRTALALSIIFLSACSKDDDSSTDSTNTGNNNPNPTLTISDILPGTWNVDDLEQINGQNFLPGTSTLVSTFTGVGQNVQGTYTFSENPNQLNSSLSYEMLLTIKFQNPGLPDQTQTVPVPATTASGSWAIDTDSNIVFTDSNNQKIFYEVINKSANALELSTPVNMTIAGQTAGFSLIMKLSK